MIDWLSEPLPLVNLSKLKSFNFRWKFKQKKKYSKKPFFPHLFVFPDKYISCKKVVGESEQRIRYETTTITITWWTGTSLERFNMVNTRWRHFSTTPTLSTWFESEHLEVSFSFLLIITDKLFKNFLLSANRWALVLS